MGAEKVLITTYYPGEGVVYSYVAQLSLQCHPEINGLTASEHLSSIIHEYEIK